MTLLIKNGRVIDPAAKQDMMADVLVQDGVIVKIMPEIQETADQEIDAGGQFVKKL